VTRRGRAICIAGALAVLVACAAAVSGPSYPVWERDVFDVFNDLPAVIGAPAQAVMQLGLFRLVPVVALVLAVVTRRWRPPVALLVAGIVGWRLSILLKTTIERSRPSAVDHLRDTAHGFGFPSGHATVSAAMATVIAPLLPRHRWLPFAVAGVVGVARMYVGVHLPLDVIGGWALGVAVGSAAILLNQPDR
jgi:undecaprenyl-diphosphatase